VGVIQSLPSLRRRGYELCAHQAVWTDLAYYVLIKRYESRLYLEIWRRIPLEGGILDAPPIPAVAKDYQPPQHIAGMNAAMQFVSNCHASLPHAQINEAERWQTTLPATCQIPAGDELLPGYGAVTFDAMDMISVCKFKDLAAVASS